MENEVKVETQETELKPVSTEEKQEWKAPETKEEMDKIMKAAENKTYTRALKELGVKSTKEFKELHETFMKEKTEIDTFKSDYEGLKNKYNELNVQHNALREDKLTKELGIPEDYKDRLLKLAKLDVNEERTLEDVLKTYVGEGGEFNFLITGKQIKMGIERQQSTDTTLTGVEREFYRRNQNIKK